MFFLILCIWFETSIKVISQSCSPHPIYKTKRLKRLWMYGRMYKSSYAYRFGVSSFNLLFLPCFINPSLISPWKENQSTTSTSIQFCYLCFLRLIFIIFLNVLFVESNTYFKVNHGCHVFFCFEIIIPIHMD